MTKEEKEELRNLQYEKKKRREEPREIVHSINGLFCKTTSLSFYYSVHY